MIVVKKNERSDLGVDFGAKLRSTNKISSWCFRVCVRLRKGPREKLLCEWQKKKHKIQSSARKIGRPTGRRSEHRKSTDHHNMVAP